MAEPEQHDCSDITRFLDERIEIPWEAIWSEGNRDQESGCQLRGESREENVQHSCRLIVGKGTAKPNEQHDATYVPRNVTLKLQESSLTPRVAIDDTQFRTFKTGAQSGGGIRLL